MKKKINIRGTEELIKLKEKEETLRESCIMDYAKKTSIKFSDLLKKLSNN